MYFYRKLISNVFFIVKSFPVYFYNKIISNIFLE